MRKYSILRCFEQYFARLYNYSEYYNNEFIEELANELLMRGYFDEDYGHWQVTPAEQAIKESFEL